MAIRNNSISRDSDITRSDRTLLLQTNIDTHAATIGVTGDLLTWAQSCHDTWEDARSLAGVEIGQTQEATQEFRKSFDECLSYYQSAKDLLLAILHELEKPDEIAVAFGIYDVTPRTRGGLEGSVNKLKRQHDIFVAESDPRVLPDAIVTNLIVLKDAYLVKWSAAELEMREQKQASEAKEELFQQDSARYKLIYTFAKLVWGIDNPLLIDLGCLPKSMVWTENKPPYPANFEWNETANEFQWLPVADVDNYEIDYRLTGASGDWTQLYKGADTSTTKKPPDPGEYDFRIRSWADDDSGAWSGVIVVNFSGGALAAPIGFKFDDTNQLFSWIKVKYADSYQLEYSRDGGQTWIMKYEGADAKFDASEMDPGKRLFRVRALNATGTSPWGITLDVWLGVPAIPLNLRWHPGEIHGDLMAIIEWDAAAGATKYQLIYLNGGDEVYSGPLTHDYDDIMSLPREHRYDVRAGNGFGWSESSAVLTIVIA